MIIQVVTSSGVGRERGEASKDDEYPLEEE
jgi:hypothetical protein